MKIEMKKNLSKTLVGVAIMAIIVVSSLTVTATTSEGTPRLEIDFVSLEVGGVVARFINTGTATATNDTYSIEIKALYRDKNYVNINYHDNNLDVNETLTIDTRDHRSIFGFGFIEITVETSAPGADSVSRRIEGFLIGPYLMKL